MTANRQKIGRKQNLNRTKHQKMRRHRGLSKVAPSLNLGEGFFQLGVLVFPLVVEDITLVVLVLPLVVEDILLLLVVIPLLGLPTSVLLPLTFASSLDAVGAGEKTGGNVSFGFHEPDTLHAALLYAVHDQLLVQVP